MAHGATALPILSTKSYTSLPGFFRPLGQTAKARPEAGQDKPTVQRIDGPIAVLVSRIATRIAGSHGTPEAGQYVSGIERIHRPVAVRVTFAGLFIVGNGCHPYRQSWRGNG